MFTSAPCWTAFRTAARSPLIAASATIGARDDAFGSGRDLARVSCAVARAALRTSAAQNRWVTFIVCSLVGQTESANSPVLSPNCLLYTSDAADERSSVDLGGRRII